jgi:hypothetical protein
MSPAYSVCLLPTLSVCLFVCLSIPLATYPIYPAQNPREGKSDWNFHYHILCLTGPSAEYVKLCASAHLGQIGRSIGRE